MKQIEGASKYFITKEGEVISYQRGVPRAMKKNPRWKYPSVQLRMDDGTKKSYLVHRLVAIAYIPNPKGYPQVNHKDGDKLNSHVENLEWVTVSENQLHAYATGLKRMPRGTLNGRNRLSEEDVLNIYQRLLEGESNTTVRESYGIGVGTLTCIKNKTNWGHLLKDLPDIKIKHKSKSLTDEQAIEICEKVVAGMTARQIVESCDFYVTQDHIWDIRRRRSFKHISGEYTW